MSTRRVTILFISFLIWAAVIWLRFFYWQVILGDSLAQAETRQGVQVSSQVSPRGEIYAQDLAPLALNEKRFDIYLWRPTLNLPEKDLLDRLEDKLGGLATASARLEKNDQSWVLIKKNLTKQQADEIENLGIEGLFLQEDTARFYPEASSSAHLLGFLGRDAAGQPKGYFGLEGYYDRQMQGQVRLVKERQGWWNKIQDVFTAKTEEKGRDLVLFLDRAVQFSVEEELKKGIEKYGAVSGWVVVIDPYSGGVLGMTSYPSYDPAAYFDFNQELFPNSVVASHFEPGSIFKPLVVAAALEEGVIKVEDHCPICSGPVQVTDYQIATWNDKYYPESTPSEIIEHSDNVGMVWIGQSLGEEGLTNYLNKLNLGKKTGIDLEEEAAIALKEGREWYPIDVATASFGQGIALTPIQMITAFSPLANGGYWVKPRVVKEVKEEEKTIPTQSASFPIFSQETVDAVKKMLIMAVEAGEAKWTKLPNYTIAGKTGTAQIPVRGHYDQEKTIASFIGFVPVDRPKFLMLVSLQEPKSSPWGSETAAPLWFAIAQRLINYWGISPDD
ncbi:MAG: penicillin-binding protein 2 [Candidatus Shapirobacteria bacterium]